jgi:hypothetical protein
VTEPLTRDDMREKAFHVVKWLTKSRAKAAPDALLVIGYLADVNATLERRLAIIIRLAREPVLIPEKKVVDAPEMTAEDKGCPEPSEHAQRTEIVDTSPQGGPSVDD